MRLVFLILFFIILLSAVFGQIPEIAKHNKNLLKNSIGISFGGSDFHIRDENASPLTYRGIGIAACVEYIRSGENYRHYIELTGCYDRLHTSYDGFLAENARASLRYNYLHQILKSKLFSNNFMIYVGGGLYSFGNFSEYRERTKYTNSVTDVIGDFWYLSHSAELTILFEYLNKSLSDFKLQFSLPFVANVSRPAYSYVPNSEGVDPFKIFGETLPFWKNIIIQFKTSYENNIRKWLYIFVRHDFQYLFYNKPRKIKMFMNNFRAGTSFLF